MKPAKQKSATPYGKAQQTQTQNAHSEIKFKAILAENKMDRFGVWIVKLEVSQGDKKAMLELSEQTEKELDITIAPPNREDVFGQIEEQ